MKIGDIILKKGDKVKILSADKQEFLGIFPYFDQEGNLFVAMNVGGLKKLKTIERNPLYKTQDLMGEKFLNV